MKKLLSMLGAVGLTATGASSAVACSTDTVKAKDVKVDAEAKTASFTKSLKLTQGTILTINPKEPDQLEIIPYKLTNEKGVTPFMGIVMKPEKDVKVDDTVHLTELNDAAFFVEKSAVADDYTQKQIGTNNNAYMLTKDAEVKVNVVMDLTKQMSQHDEEFSWTLVDLNQNEDGYKVTGIKDNIKINLTNAYTTPSTSPEKLSDAYVEPSTTPEK